MLREDIDKKKFKKKECYKSECIAKGNDGFLNWYLEWYQIANEVMM